MIILKRLNETTLVFLWDNGSLDVRIAEDKESLDYLIKSCDLLLDVGEFSEFDNSDFEFLFDLSYEINNYIHIDELDDYIYLEKNVPTIIN